MKRKLSEEKLIEKVLSKWHNGDLYSGLEMLDFNMDINKIDYDERASLETKVERINDGAAKLRRDALMAYLDFYK